MHVLIPQQEARMLMMKLVMVNWSWLSPYLATHLRIIELVVVLLVGIRVMLMQVLLVTTILLVLLQFLVVIQLASIIRLPNILLGVGKHRCLLYR